ncbi:hypothetical protein BKA67DRAFT_652779 [Truncatella angustata]|uniref:Uncharacterized protein n=1 Tax=Truncatella angustata TaxID=152316 RepID=A0A9P9A2X2_9PEZI|nr:uncharacterized protein BKA67DRAFT_652779 [Truncatella angustata]KAH6659553.1 hypothetical protein BKA67DRAFT_652779 [Truncatella angustata]
MPVEPLAGDTIKCSEEGIFRTFDSNRITSFFTLHAISNITFGQTFGFLERDENPFSYIQNLSQFPLVIIVFGVYTELTHILKLLLLKPALPKNINKRGLGCVTGSATDRVRERFVDSPVVQLDILGASMNKGRIQGELGSQAPYPTYS